MRIKKLLILLLVTIPFWTNAQQATISQTINWLNSNLKEIQQDKMIFNHQFEYDPQNFDFMTIRIKESDSKGGGETIEYQFYPGHINPNKTKFDVHKTEINVTLYAKEGLRVIKKHNNGTFSAFKGKIVLRCDDPQLAKDVISQMNQIMENAAYKGIQLANKEAALQWLTTNIGDLGLTNTMTKQKFEHFPDKRDKLTLNVTTGKSNTHWQYDFYANDFNAYSGKLEPEGEQLLIRFWTIENQKLVKIFRDGEQQKFDKFMQLYANDAKMAMDILEAFKIVFGGSPTNLPDTQNSGTGSSSAIPSNDTPNQFTQCEFNRNEIDPFTKKRIVITTSPMHKILFTRTNVAFGLSNDQLLVEFQLLQDGEDAIYSTDMNSRLWLRTNNDQVIELAPFQPHTSSIDKNIRMVKECQFKPEFHITREQLKMIADSGVTGFRITTNQGTIERKELGAKNQGKIQKAASCLLGEL